MCPYKMFCVLEKLDTNWTVWYCLDEHHTDAHRRTRTFNPWTEGDP